MSEKTHHYMSPGKVEYIGTPAEARDIAAAEHVGRADVGIDVRYLTAAERMKAHERTRGKGLGQGALKTAVRRAPHHRIPSAV